MNKSMKIAFYYPLALVTVTIFIISSLCVGNTSPDDIFIYKSYGDFSPEGKGSCISSVPPYIEWGQQCYCHLTYRGPETKTERLNLYLISASVYKEKQSASYSADVLMARNIVGKGGATYKVDDLEGKDRIVTMKKGVVYYMVLCILVWID